MSSISVITPVYNGAMHIGQAMQSVACSLIDKDIVVEHILIDDGSTDETGVVIEKARSLLIDTAYNCRLLRTAHSGKPAAARNYGIEAARGEFIFCLDHDDVLLQNTLRHLIVYLESGSDEVVYGDFLRCDGAMSYVIGDDYCGKDYCDASAALLSLFLGEHFFQHSLMFTKRLWNEVGGYDKIITFGEDFDLCVRFILAGHVPLHVPVTTHLHRNHADGMTACYLDRSVCPVWLAEHRAHYWKHAQALTRHLSECELSDVMRVLQIEPDTPISGPPSRETATALAATMKLSEARFRPSSTKSAST